MHHKLKKIAAVVTGISLMTSLGCMSAFVDKKIQAKGIKAKYLAGEISGSVTYSKEHTETLSYTVPANTKMTVKKRMDSATTSYNSTVQLQHYLILAGEWYDEGDPSEKKSKRTEKYPAFKYVKVKKKK